MRIVGEWWLFPDGVTRPVVTATMLDAAGQSVSIRFLVDSGGDRTALNASALDELRLPQEPSPADVHVRGITGESSYVTVRSAIEFTKDDGGVAKVRGEFLGLTDPAASDLCVLGRDVTDNFDLILSRRRADVLLLAPTHEYRVVRMNDRRSEPG